MINFIEESHTYWTEMDGATYMEVPSVSSILTEMLGLDYAKINPFYADRGTAVHKAIELTHEDNLDESSVDEEVKPFLDGYFDFLEKTKFKPMLWEQRLFSKRLWVAGTMDIAGTIGFQILNQRHLIDIKTGQKQKWHQLQTAGYALMLSEEMERQKTPITIERHCLYIDKKSKWKLDPHNNKSDFSVFESMATVYNRKGDYR